MFNENLHTYVRTFGTNIVFNCADGSILEKDTEGQPLKGIFDNAYFLQAIGDMDIDNTQPRLTCVLEDVASVKSEDSVTINNTKYDVTNDPQPDGAGMCVIPLTLFGRV